MGLLRQRFVYAFIKLRTFRTRMWPKIKKLLILSQSGADPELNCREWAILSFSRKKFLKTITYYSKCYRLGGYSPPHWIRLWSQYSLHLYCIGWSVIKMSISRCKRICSKCIWFYIWYLQYILLINSYFAFFHILSSVSFKEFSNE